MPRKAAEKAKAVDEPICNIDVEQSLLGAILVNNGAYARVKKFLRPEHFFDGSHQAIFQAMITRIEEGRRADFKTIAKALPDDWRAGELDGPAYIARLAIEAVSVVGARDYGLEILEQFNRRATETMGYELVKLSREANTGVGLLEQVAPIENALNALRFDAVKDDPRSQVGTRFLKKLTDAHQRGNVRGVAIGLPEMREVLSEPNFEATNLYGLLSSSGEGKTSLMVQIVRHALEEGHPVLIQSYDLNEEQLVRQMMTQSLGIETKRLRTGELSEREWEQIVDYTTGLNQAPFEVQKCTTEDAPKLVSMARDFCKRRVADPDKPALIVTDHIGAVTCEDERGNEGVKAKRISGRLKTGAEECDAAWLVLQQRNSSGMIRDNPRPISADLYGGEGAKQAYDAIVTLYRPEKYRSERQAIAAGSRDHAKIQSVFGSKGASEAELGAIKVRFGNPRVRVNILFEEAFTRYVSAHVATDFGGFQ